MRLEKIIAANLVYLMTANNENQVELSRVLDISNSTVSNYVLGKVLPDLDILIDIAKHYGCTLDDLVTLKYYPKPCPFCGAIPKLSQIGDQHYLEADHKQDCYLKEDTISFGTEEEVIEAWNKRV